MEIKLKSAELHNTLIIGGKNFQKKLSTQFYPTLSIVYDDTKALLHIAYNGVTKTIPGASVAEMEAVDHSLFGIDMKADELTLSPPPAPKTKIKAQASAPPGIRI